MAIMDSGGKSRNGGLCPVRTGPLVPPSVQRNTSPAGRGLVLREILCKCTL